MATETPAAADNSSPAASSSSGGAAAKKDEKKEKKPWRPTRLQCIALVEAYGSAWARQDPAAICALFTEDATYNERPFVSDQALFVGRSEIEKYWKRQIQGKQTNIRFKQHTEDLMVDEEKSCCLVKWEARFDSLAKGERRPVHFIQVAILHLLPPKEPSPHPQIKSLEEYWHSEGMDGWNKGGELENLAVIKKKSQQKSQAAGAGKDPTICWTFARGKCKRKDCPFSHEIAKTPEELDSSWTVGPDKEAPPKRQRNDHEKRKHQQSRQPSMEQVFEVAAAMVSAFKEVVQGPKMQDVAPPSRPPQMFPPAPMPMPMPTPMPTPMAEFPPKPLQMPVSEFPPGPTGPPPTPQSKSAAPAAAPAQSKSVPTMPPESAVLAAQPVSLPSKSVSMPPESAVLAAQPVSLPSKSVSMPPESAVLAAQPVSLPSKSVSMPPESAVIAAPPVSLPAKSVSMPSEPLLAPSFGEQLLAPTLPTPAKPAQPKRGKGVRNDRP